MPIILHNAAIRALVAVRGHPFDRTAFDAVFQAMDGISATMVDQPAAALLMNPSAMADFDALVLYDMPGLDFTAPEHAPAYLDPSPALKAGFETLLAEGKGVVALHHALAGGACLSGFVYFWLVAPAKVITQSQPSITVAIGSGLLVGLVAVAASLSPPWGVSAAASPAASATNAFAVQLFLQSAAFWLVVGGLFAKSYRVFRLVIAIVINPRLRRVQMRVRCIFFMMVVHFIYRESKLDPTRWGRVLAFVAQKFNNVVL